MGAGGGAYHSPRSFPQPPIPLAATAYRWTNNVIICYLSPCLKNDTNRRIDN